MTDTLTVLALLGLSIWLSVFSVRGLVVSLGVRRRSPRDVSGEGILIPAEAAGNARGLLELGFRELGQVQLDFPLRRAPETVWVFLQPDGLVVGEVVRQLVSFATYFGESRLENTLFPVGERIRSDHYVTDFVDSSISRAFEAHLQRLQVVPKHHGSPTRIGTIEDYIQMSVVWRQKLGSRLLRRHIILDVAVLAATAYAAVVVLFFALFTDWVKYVAAGTPPRLPALIMLLGPVLLIMLIRIADILRTATKLHTAR